MDPTSPEFIAMTAGAVVVMGGVMGVIYWVLYQTQYWYGSDDGYYPINFSNDEHDWHDPYQQSVLIDIEEGEN